MATIFGFHFSQEIIPHPYHSRMKDNIKVHENDVALLRLAKRIHFSKSIRPACLETDISDVNPNKTLNRVAWVKNSSEFNKK